VKSWLVSATCSRSLCYCSYHPTDVELPKFYSRIHACWLQKAVDLELPTSHYPVPLFYVDRYARWLSVAGTLHLPQHTSVADSLHRNPVRGRTAWIVVPPYTDIQIVGGDHRGLLPFLNTWNQSRVSVEPSESLTICCHSRDRLNCLMTLTVLYVTVFCEYASKHYGTVCVKVQTEALVPVSTVCFHS
jgi:hypothetical protein